MMWSDEIETNLHRLRRYAALASGTVSVGDNVVNRAVELLLAEGPPDEPASAAKLFERVDRALRAHLDQEPASLSGFGRWQLLEPLERRLVLLVVMEGFPTETAARIAGVPASDARAALSRARMRYVDRFPARVGLVGVNTAVRERVSVAVRKSGHRVLWSLEDGRPVPESTLDVPNVILLVGRADDASPVVADRAANYAQCSCLAGLRRDLGSTFTGPVVVARGSERRERLDARVWLVPVSDLADDAGLRRTLSKALLFTA
ncbi:MAG: hypothetical protein H6847_12880 [Hyphomonas sp.]|nr:hypothetical protein [Hyphomonas sp.]